MLLRYTNKFQRFFQETRQPIWQAKGYATGEAEDDYIKYGTFDYSRFSEIELRLYILIKSRIASMSELKTCYTLDEAIKIYSLYKMEIDIEKGKAAEMERRNTN